MSIHCISSFDNALVQVMVDAYPHTTPSSAFSGSSEFVFKSQGYTINQWKLKVSQLHHLDRIKFSSQPKFTRGNPL